jgi:hypothetical protein
MIGLRKLWPFQVEGVNNSKNKPTDATKTGFQTPKKFLVCCSIANKVPKMICRTSSGAPIAL